MQIGVNIKNARKKKGFTQEELALQIGVTSAAVSRWESCVGLPDISMIVPLAQVLSVSTDELFGMEQNFIAENQYIELKNMYEKIESSAVSPSEAALRECEMLLEFCENNPGNYMYSTCLVERTANLSRNLDGIEKSDWTKYHDKALQYGMSVIRFCNSKEWVERTHFAMAWIYIHDRDFASAKEHIEMLPSITSNRLQESILAQMTSIEQGPEGMKKVLNKNLQNFTRSLNKEFLYAASDLSWSVEPEEAISFAKWGLHVMNALTENEYMLPYCRGFFRDIYLAILHADLRANDIKMAAVHFNELKEGMKKHYDYYQTVFDNDEELGKYPERQIRNMKAYTKEFIQEKQKAILQRLKEWHGEEKVKLFTEYNLEME